jgi:hypothetical protein
MSFGRLSTPISLIQTTQTIDAQGFGQSTDIVLATIRAYQEERHGTKIWTNRAAFSTATTLFRFRAIPGVTITPALTILYAGVRYKIPRAGGQPGACCRGHAAQARRRNRERLSVSYFKCNITLYNAYLWR